jgi:hypothetical protein
MSIRCQMVHYWRTSLVAHLDQTSRVRSSNPTPPISKYACGSHTINVLTYCICSLDIANSGTYYSVRTRSLRIRSYRIFQPSNLPTFPPKFHHGCRTYALMQQTDYSRRHLSASRRIQIPRSWEPDSKGIRRRPSVP